jgi:hypothetical protein
MIGTVYFGVDPKDPRNQVIADLDKAPRNAAGRVGGVVRHFVNCARLESAIKRHHVSHEVPSTADALVQKSYLLADDVSRVMQRAGDTWDLVVRDAGTQP